MVDYMYFVNFKVFKYTLDLWKEVKRFEYPTDAVLSKFFRDNRKINKNDKNIIAETIYTILRNYYKLHKVTQSDELLILCAWINLMKVSTDDIAEIFSRTYHEYLDLDKLDYDVIELPEWVIEKLLKVMSLDEIKALDKEMSAQARLTLRTNTLKINRKDLIAELKQQNIIATETKYSPWGVVIKEKASLMNNDLFANGCFEVQDESSQLAGLFFDAKRSEMITDFCAGSGGKTLVFGMTMKNTGRIYSFDVNERRLNNMKPRLSKSGLSNIYPQLITSEKDSKLKRLAEKMDRVFVDAPCLGFGTIRRNPDLKFRQSINSLAEINEKQISILSSAAKLVKSGGVLAYATCSILPEENQNIVQQFLESNPDYKIIELNELANDIGLELKDNNYLELFPHIHGTDGFFCCLMKKD